MYKQPLAQMAQVVEYIENNLCTTSISLGTIASAAHYSKYYLHRAFHDAFGITIHEYLRRRRLTLAAELLADTQMPLLQVALRCGYQSQQAFGAAFKAYYKKTPACYRAQGLFYRLQPRLMAFKGALQTGQAPIRLATPDDVPAWMALLHLVEDGYPCLNVEQHLRALKENIRKQQAFLLHEGGTALGAAALERETGHILFLGVHPRYRRHGIQERLIQTLRQNCHGKALSIITFRAHDRADPGYRKEIESLHFQAREPLVAFGYPAQRFVLPCAESWKSENGRK
ncbi:MAG TPA: GNAT family N-acetyltransferase [Candidatus Aphodomonas merdavium]|nr:GNAT family N-acetyltransferase [Candidatus Aphodomonas merdavium]